MTMMWKLRSPHTYGKSMSFVAGIEHPRQTAAQAGTVSGCNFRAVHSWQHDDEFIAADTSLDIGLPEITYWKMFALMVLVRLIVPAPIKFDKKV